MPVVNTYGWGVIGRYLTQEMVAITDIRLITKDFSSKDVGDPLVCSF